MTKRPRNDSTQNPNYSIEELCAKAPHLLDKLASLFSLSPYDLRYPQGGVRLKQNLFNLSMFLHRYEELTTEQRAIFLYCCQSAGRPILPDKLYKELVSHLSVAQINKALLALTRVGWIIELQQPQAFFVLAEIPQILPHLEPFKQFLYSKAPDDAAPLPSARWFDDIIALAAFCFLEQPKITNKGIIAKSSLRKLADVLTSYAIEDWEAATETNTYPTGLSLMIRLLSDTHCLTKTPAEHGVSLTLALPAWEDLSLLKPAEQHLIAVASYLRSLHYEGNFRTALCAILSGWQETPGWITASSLLPFIGKNEQSLFNQTDRLSREGQLVSQALRPLAYLGLVEHTQADLPVTWTTTSSATRLFWRLSPLGLVLAKWMTKHCGKDVPRALTHLLGHPADLVQLTYTPQARELLDNWQGLLPMPLVKELIIQPDLSIILPKNSSPGLIWLLSVAADLEQQEYLYRGSFAKNQLMKSLKMGLQLDWLLDALREQCKIPPAESVFRTLSDWGAGFDKTLFAQVLILACDTPEMASELLAQTKLKGIIVGAVGPRTLIISREGEPIVRRWLEKKGWVPRPGIAAGETAAIWLEKRNAEHPTD